MAATPSQWVLFYTCGGGVARDFCGAGGGTGVGRVRGVRLFKTKILSQGRRTGVSVLHLRRRTSGENSLQRSGNG